MNTMLKNSGYNCVTAASNLSKIARAAGYPCSQILFTKTSLAPWKRNSRKRQKLKAIKLMRLAEYERMRRIYNSDKQ